MNPFQPTRDKLLTRAEAADFCRRCRADGGTVVFTNGCFDLLHAGHVDYLERSRQLGCALVVGLNTDESVRRLKGPGRPIQSQDDRARILAGLACVDAVVCFDEDTPLELVRAVQPDVLAKGADWGDKTRVVGADVVEARGGRVVLMDLVPGKSTTELMNRLRAARPAP